MAKQYRGRRVTYETADRQRSVDYLGVIIQYAVAIVLVCLIIMFCKKGYDIGYAVLANEAVDVEGEGETVTVTVIEGQSVNQIGEMLEENGVILDGAIFPMQELLSSYHNKIRPGTYELSTEMTPTTICETMAEDTSDEETDTSGTESSTTDSTESDSSTSDDVVYATTDVWPAIAAMFTDPNLGQFQQ